MDPTSPPDALPATASLNELLQWSVLHSSPDALASAVQRGDRLDSSAIDSAWLDAMFPDEAKKMNSALALAADTNAAHDDREKALDDVLFMVESIDAAIDLPKIDGLTPLLALASAANEHPTLRTGAAWILVTAAQNNPFTQGELLNKDAITTVARILAEEIPALTTPPTAAPGPDPMAAEPAEPAEPAEVGSDVAASRRRAAFAAKLLSLLSALLEHPRGMHALLAAQQEARVLDSLAAVLALRPSQANPRTASLIHRAVFLLSKALHVVIEPPVLTNPLTSFPSDAAAAAAAEAAASTPTLPPPARDAVIGAFTSAGVFAAVINLLADPSVSLENSLSIFEAGLAGLVRARALAAVSDTAVGPAVAHARAQLGELAQAGSYDDAIYSTVLTSLVALEAKN